MATKIDKIDKIDKINAARKKTNDAFKNATAAQKRVLIAQDVLNQIKSHRYVPSRGIWVDVRWSENLTGNQSYEFASVQNEDTRPEVKNLSVQQLFADHIIETCEVCALGGLFMSCTNLNNNTTLNELSVEGECELGNTIHNKDKLSNGLNRFFSYAQLTLIEVYFEQGLGYFGRCGHTETHVRGANQDHVNAFNNKYPEDVDRLKEIMKNIIANEGTFVPSKLKVAKY